MKVRTQITLDQEMQKQAQCRADALGISLPEYIRRLLERDLVPSLPKSDVTSIFNLGSSGGSNIARDKDAMIAKAIEASHKRFRKSA